MSEYEAAVWIFGMLFVSIMIGFCIERWTNAKVKIAQIFKEELKSNGDQDNSENS